MIRAALCLILFGFIAGCSGEDDQVMAAAAPAAGSAAAGAPGTADTGSTGGPVPAAAEDGIRVFFSPDGGCTAAILHEVKQAKATVHVQASDLTYKRIADSLREAHGRGVKVIVLIDETQQDKKHADSLAAAGVPVHVDAAHKTAHNKVILIDGRVIITGSFNFTKESEKSKAENLLVIAGKPRLAEAYERNFQDHLAHSTPLPAN